MPLIIKNGWIVTLNKKKEIFKGDIYIEKDCISEIFPGGGSQIPDAEIIEAHDQVIVPGMINAHTHLFQSLFRGLGDGMDFGVWQAEVTYPLYEQLRAEDAYLFTLLGCLENIRSGVSTVVNFQAYPNDFEACEYTARAIRETGLRGVLVKSFFGQNAPRKLVADKDQVLSDCRAVLENLSGCTDDRIKFWLGPPMPAQASPEIIRAAHEIARQHGVGLHMHTAESAALVKRDRKIIGKGEIEFLHDLGVLDDKFHAVHSVALSTREIDLIAETGAHVVHCPVSNMFLGSGIAPIVEMIGRGINIALGTDGSATNNNQDMISTMKTTSLLQKVQRLDSSVMPQGMVLQMATLNGAKAVGMNATIGSIEKGKKADMTLLDFQTSHTIPVHKPVSTLVYAATYADVSTLIIDGRFVMKDRKILTMDEAGVLSRAQDLADRLLEKTGKSYLKNQPWPNV